MKRFPAILLLSLGFVPATAQAETSVSIGFLSDYIFRGFFQEDATGYVGLDHAAENGFHIGTWLGEVGQGVEYDVVLGYGGSAGEMGWDLSYGRYMYTNKFDDTYHEINLGLSYGDFAVNLINGEYGNWGDDLDYSFISAAYSHESGVSATFGSWGKDFEGSYVEVGYGFDFNGLDLSASIVGSSDIQVYNTEHVTPTNPADDGTQFTIVFGINKTIGIGN